MISKVESLFSHNIALPPYMSRIFDFQYAYQEPCARGLFRPNEN
jgi:hypothetical protein